MGFESTRTRVDPGARWIGRLLIGEADEASSWRGGDWRSASGREGRFHHVVGSFETLWWICSGSVRGETRARRSYPWRGDVATTRQEIVGLGSCTKNTLSVRRDSQKVGSHDGYLHSASSGRSSVKSVCKGAPSEAAQDKRLFLQPRLTRRNVPDPRYYNRTVQW